MTNREKEQYLSDMMIFRSHAFIHERSTINNFFKKMPKTLYKIHSFKEYSYAMLEEPYAYLSPVIDLDDPFDCLTNMGFGRKNKNENASIGLSKFDYVFKTICQLGNIKIDKREAKKMVTECYVNGEFDEMKAKVASERFGSIPDKTKQLLFGVFRNLDNITETIIKDQSIMNLTKIASNPGSEVGVCSMTTKRDNKVMWSLYGDKYSGYCVEYEIPNDDEIRFNLCPVLYKRNDDNNFIHKVVKLAIANCIRFISEGQMNNGIGCMNELFCTKDRDWNYQDEWRLIGNAKKHCRKLKIKAVYLGFKVTNEHKIKVKEIALKKGFRVFFMDAPKGSKKIYYSELK